METLKINKKHWSYKMVTMFSSESHIESMIRWNEMDSCDYNKMVFWSSVGTLFFSLLALVTGFAATFFLIVTGILWLNSDVLLLHSTEAMPMFDSVFYTVVYIYGLVAVSLPILLGGSIGLVAGLVWVGKMWERKSTSTTPSKTRELYLSWKEKYCKKIELVD